MKYLKSHNRGWEIKTKPTKYLILKVLCDTLSSLSADKDLQFHIVQQARAQSAKEGIGYTEGKWHPGGEIAFQLSCGELLNFPF